MKYITIFKVGNRKGSILHGVKIIMSQNGVYNGTKVSENDKYLD